MVGFDSPVSWQPVQFLVNGADWHCRICHCLAHDDGKRQSSHPEFERQQRVASCRFGALNGQCSSATLEPLVGIAAKIIPAIAMENGISVFGNDLRWKANNLY